MEKISKDLLSKASVIEICFYDVPQTIKRPLSVLCKASEYFESYFFGPMKNNYSNQYHLKDFTFTEFMQILPFIDDPYQPIPDLCISLYFGLKQSTWNHELNENMETSQLKTEKKELYFPLQSQNGNPVSFYRKRIDNIAPSPAYLIHRDISINKENCFPIDYEQDSTGAFQFQFLYPSTSCPIDSICLMSEHEEKDQWIENPIATFSYNELIFCSQKGYEIITFPMFQMYHSFLQKLKSHRYYFKIHFSNGIEHVNIRFMYLLVILGLEEKDRFTVPHETFHSIPLTIGSMNLGQSGKVTTSINMEKLVFNMIYFRLSLSSQSYWPKDHFPHFHDAKLIATCEMVDEEELSPPNEILTSDHISLLACRTLKTLILDHLNHGDLVEIKSGTIQADINGLHFEMNVESMNQIRTLINNHIGDSGLHFEMVNIIQSFEEQMEFFEHHDIPRLLVFLDELISKKQLQEDIMKQKKENPVKRLILFEQSLFSLSMHHIFGQQPFSNDELFHEHKSEQHGKIIGVWQMDIARNLITYFRGSKVVNVKNITFEVQGDTCSNVPIDVDIIINRLMIERIYQENRRIVDIPKQFF